jgi:hypothetical protein
MLDYLFETFVWLLVCGSVFTIIFVVAETFYHDYEDDDDFFE